MSETPQPSVDIEVVRSEVDRTYQLEQPRVSPERFNLHEEEPVNTRIWSEPQPIEVAVPSRQEQLAVAMEGLSLAERLHDIRGIGERVELIRQAKAA